MTALSQAPRNGLGVLEARPADVLKHPEVLVVDVRTESELLGPLGHIEGVCHVPMDAVLAEGLAGVAPSRPVILVCEAGMRSLTCARALVARGFAEVYTLVGGMRRWNAEERPVARNRSWRSALPV